MNNSSKLSINEFSNVQFSKTELTKLTGGRKRYFIGSPRDLQEVTKEVYDGVAGTNH